MSSRNQKTSPKKPATVVAKSTPKPAAISESKTKDSPAVVATPELGRRVIKPPAKFDDDDFPSRPTSVKKTPASSKQTVVAKQTPKVKPTIQHAAVTAESKVKSSFGQTIVTRPMAKKGAEMEKKVLAGDATKKKTDAATKAVEKKPASETKKIVPSDKVVMDSLDSLRVVLSPVVVNEDKVTVEKEKPKGAEEVVKETKKNEVKKPAVVVTGKKGASPARSPVRSPARSPMPVEAKEVPVPESVASEVLEEEEAKEEVKTAVEAEKTPAAKQEIDREAIIAKAMAMIRKDKTPGVLAKKITPISVEKAFGQPKERKVLALSPSVNITKPVPVIKVKPKPVEKSVEKKAKKSVVEKKPATKKSIKGNILYEKTASGEIVARLANEKDFKELEEARRASELEDEDDEWGTQKIYDCPITDKNVEEVIDKSVSTTSAMRQLLCSFRDELRRNGFGPNGTIMTEAADEETNALMAQRRAEVCSKVIEAFIEYQVSIDNIADFASLPRLDFTAGNWNIAEVDTPGGKKKPAGGTAKKRGAGNSVRGRGGGRGALVEKRARLSTGDSSFDGNSEDSNSSWGDLPLSSPSPPPPPPRARAPKPPKPPVEPEAISDDLWMSCECISDDDDMQGIGVGFTSRIR